jgi:hypothetical protein
MTIMTILMFVGMDLAAES